MCTFIRSLHGEEGRSVQKVSASNVRSGNARATRDAPQEARSPDLLWGEQAPCSSPAHRTVLIQKSIDHVFGGRGCCKLFEAQPPARQQIPPKAPQFVKPWGMT